MTLPSIIVDDYVQVPRDYTGIIIYITGDKYWVKKGLLHREDGPAVEGINGHKEYRLNEILILDEGIYWFLVLTFIKNNKKIPYEKFKEHLLMPRIWS